MSRTRRKIKHSNNYRVTHFTHGYCIRPLTDKEKEIESRDGVGSDPSLTSLKKLLNRNMRSRAKQLVNKVHQHDDYEDFDFDHARLKKLKYVEWLWY